DFCGSTIDISIRLWSGLEGGGKPIMQTHKLNRAEIAWLDEDTDDLFYLSDAILKSTDIMSKNSAEKQHLLRILNNAFLKVDWSYPGSVDFYHSVEDAQNCINAEINNMSKNHPVNIKALGHTHIDVAWLWRLKHTREKIARS